MNSETCRYYQLERPELADLLPVQYSRVLEVGCGEGLFRKNLNQEHEYWGIEPVLPAAKRAKDRLDKVLVGTYQEVEQLIPSNYFDLVVCNDVIEHMPDHDSFLQSIKQKVNCNGCLVASLPNVRYILNLKELLINKDWQYRNAGILDKTHLRFFTRKSLIHTLNNNSFSIDRITGINCYEPGSTVGRIKLLASTLLLGNDTKFLQYGVRFRSSHISN